MNYEPRGKVKVLLDAMRADPARVWTAVDVAQVMEVSQGTVLAYLKTALDNNALFKTLLKGKNLFGLQPFGEVAQPVRPVHAPDRGWKPPVMVPPRGTPAPRAEPQPQAYPPPPEPEPKEVQEPPEQDTDTEAEVEGEQSVPFNACLWMDGDLDLHGLEELEDGGHRISAADVRRLRQMLAWMPA